MGDLEVQFAEVAGSNWPPISTVVLPAIPGIAGYGVSEQQSDGSWSDPVPVAPLQSYKFSGGTTGVSFYAVNQKGKAEKMLTFDFDITFSGSAEVQAQLSDVSLITAPGVENYFRSNQVGRMPRF